MTGGGSSMKSKQIMTLVGMGILTAIVIVLQMVASAIHFGPFSITLVLAPIIIGAALYGPGAGAWLGTVFGAMVLLTGDAAAFLAVNVPGTICTCILKGLLAGLAAGAVYKLLEKKNQLASVVTAGIVCPVVNTGVFLLGCLVFFLDTVKEWGAGAGYENVGAYFLFGFVGLNFVIELAINLVLSTAIVRILKILTSPAGAAR
ncbi:MAG: ECF transporter S component [Ruminococcus sp.]|nr:ECF transporter S component [Ruminococcus sp.]